MEPSWRKPFGMLLIVALIAVWAVLVVTLVDHLAPHPALAGVIYLAAGIAWLWIFPMKRLLRWMELGKWRE